MSAYRKAIAAGVGLLALLASRHGVEIPQQAVVDVILALGTLAAVYQARNQP